MYKVALIGDSIRMGYQPIVQRLLSDIADVWGPEENCGDSRNVLDHLGDWLCPRQPDIVHVNCGLHDIKTPFDVHNCAVPLIEYELNVREILDYILHDVPSLPIWATITPVNYGWHHENKPFDRYGIDVTAYNEAAVSVTRSFDMPIDDLFVVMMGAGFKNYQAYDGVHFKPSGYVLLAEHVAGSIRDIIQAIEEMT